MPDGDSRATAVPSYAFAQLERAIATLLGHEDPEVRERAGAKVERWRAVLAGMADGTLDVGSRTPVANTPAWVTLEVAHGGFATGSYLAEGALLDHEELLLAQLPDDAPGSTDRERLNLWFLRDEGRAQLLERMESHQLRVRVPEEGALPVVSWLLAQRHTEQALDLIAAIRPLMHRLRFYPEFLDRPRPAGALVHVASVGTIRNRLRRLEVPEAVATMNEALTVWNPLRDRLVSLWLETVDGDLPRLERAEEGSSTSLRVVGGWPCARWPTHWEEQRRLLLHDLQSAAKADLLCGKHRNPKSTIRRLWTALERCRSDSSALTGRDVGVLRRALAGALHRHGAPGSPDHDTLRQSQAATAAHPTRDAFGELVARRLDALPEHGGVSSLEAGMGTAEEGESERIPTGTKLPRSMVRRLSRALEAPIAELVDRGLVPSGEVLATVLSQVTGQVIALGIEDPVLQPFFGQIYTAFRRRRSLLLLNLEHQVQLEELPWVRALDVVRDRNLDAQTAALQTMQEAMLLALSTFPQTQLPNPLVSELKMLCETAGLEIPLVEEVASDIFMGVFTDKWRRAADRTSTLLQGTLYARYYGLPQPGHPALAAPKTPRSRKSWFRAAGKAADAFSELCRSRAADAQKGRARTGGYVAGNGMVIEQSQVLTTHNLAPLVEGLGLRTALDPFLHNAVRDIFEWIPARHRQSPGTFRAQLQLAKNTAFAWRQALYFLSLLDEASQHALFGELQGLIRGAAAEGEGWALRFRPVMEGLRFVLAGGRFRADGTMPDGRGFRLLGWSTGPHPLIDPAAPTS